MGNVLHIDQVITRRVDAELARARAIFGCFNMDLLTLESGRGDWMDDRELLRALCYLNRTGRLFKRVLKQVNPD
jgi:hypothetical protein